MRCVAVGGMLVVLIFAWSRTAAADPKRGAEAEAQPTPGGGGQVQVELTVPTGKGSAGEGGGGGGGMPATDGHVSEERGTTTEFWRRGEAHPGRGAGGCTNPDEVLFERVRRDTRTGTTTVIDSECRNPADTPGPSTPPPPPPTVEELTDLARAQIVSPSVGTNPHTRGITGLPTRLWYEGPTEASVSTAIRGYSVTANMHPTQYCWDPGDGGNLVCSPQPGSESAWAQEYTYDTKGRYALTLEAVWNGTWTFSGHGARASGDLATIRTLGSRDYQVNEVRGELRETR